MTTASDLRTAAELGAQALEREPQLLARIVELEAKVAPRTLWGSSVWRNTGETYQQALTRTEMALGPLEIVRDFSPAGPLWNPNTGARPLHHSFKYLPLRVLTGMYDTEIRSWAFTAPDRPTWYTYWHEPEDEIRDGLFTAADYRNAWDRIIGIVRTAGKDLRPTLVLMGWTLDPASQRNWLDYYSNNIDVLAWDPYASRSTSYITGLYQKCVDASASVRKKWAIAETGADAALLTPTLRAPMLKAMSSYLSKMPNKPEFVCYFDSPVNGLWPISNDAAAAEAWKAGRA